MKTIKILVVEDNSDILRGIRALLNPDDEFEIVGEIHGSEKTIEITKKKTPDIVLLDIEEPGIYGLKPWNILIKFPHLQKS